MTLVQVTEVTHRFGSFTAVDRVSLTVEAGEVVGLLGANGAGKTTLIRCILGLLRPTAGEVRLFDRPPSRQTRSRLGYLPQGLGLYEDLTVAENLAFAARAFGRADGASGTASATATGDAVLDPDVAAVADELVGDLPLGLRRRVAFAAALGHHLDLLVLDEPTSGVDPLGRTRLWDTIRAAAEGGAGVLVTTHHMSEAEQCDRLVVMAGGRVAAEGTMAAIMGDASTVQVSTPRWEDAFVALEEAGLPVALVGRALRVPGADREQVAAALDAARVEAELRLVPATFEETFVALAAPLAAA
jgi:ABC-2 type transport system ATP-binding protein